MRGEREEGRKDRKTRRRPDSSLVSVLPSSLPRLHSSARFNLPAGRRQFNLQPNTLLCLTRGAPTFNYTFRLTGLRVWRHRGVCGRVANEGTRTPETTRRRAADNDSESIGAQLLNPRPRLPGYVLIADVFAIRRWPPFPL